MTQSHMILGFYASNLIQVYSKCPNFVCHIKEKHNALAFREIILIGCKKENLQ